MTTTRMPLLALAILACVGTSPRAQEPVARSNSLEADASLYGQSVALPRQAAVCGEHLPGYAQRFQPAFEAWRADNAQRIAAGSKFVHDSAARGGVDADAGVAKLGDEDAQRLRKTTPELLERHCRLLLESLAPQPN
jgi:hypothetical protein